MKENKKEMKAYYYGAKVAFGICGVYSLTIGIIELFSGNLNISTLGLGGFWLIMIMALTIKQRADSQ